MGRRPRASAAAAARKILSQAAGERQALAVEFSRTRGTTKRTKRNISRVYDENIDDDEEGHDEDGSFEKRDGTYEVKEEDEESVQMERLPEEPVVKKRKIGHARTLGDKGALFQRLFAPKESEVRENTPATRRAPLRGCCTPPERLHSVDYHRPLLLDGAGGRAGRRALLAWYDGVSTARGMPWRKPWQHPQTYLDNDNGDHGTAAGCGRDALAKRAYEVWVSEIMAQQTRIAVVVDYWTRWMARWPTVGDLAAAADHEVQAAWSGLGYYSRAARLHAAARAVVADPELRGLLPADVAMLQARVPGVGRYTAGAIAAIVFGQPAAMVDGNVVRVLSRQMGLFADSKTDKALADLLWEAAEALVQAVARDRDDKSISEPETTSKAGSGPELSDRPGRWGQALMELGSTVCTPTPDCTACPISATCRTYAEGLMLHCREKGIKPEPNMVGDIEDEYTECHVCEQFPEDDDDGDDTAATTARNRKNKKAKSDAAETQKTKTRPTRTTASPFFVAEDSKAAPIVDDEATATIVRHAKKFPLRRPKKPPRELETLVCAVRATDGRYLLHRRPAKGLLAGLWQLPSHDLPVALSSKAARRKEAEAFVKRWLSGGGCSCGRGCVLTTKDGKGNETATCSLQVCKELGAARLVAKSMEIQELGSIPWLFSHIRQTMHVYLFVLPLEGEMLPTPASCSWALPAEAENTYSMGTGMRKCWSLVKEAW
ncbi:DNA glycosylase [Niveomyces insectorum RCEF 264]|uniref:Adenine DNA glycosylase n=1 Tax=Niveomyces insectorum RCEF 264 TaxID=1081102 RepID=A0A167P1W8_9HYPO|nr:DNA glycosylase [Niveomyces insectorum RCEF 264]